MAKAIRVALALSLLPFAAFAGDATVSWGEVTQRTDGSPVTITDYRVYFTPDTAPTKADSFVTVQGLSYRFDGLAPATWYFAATALDSAGLESALSVVVNKTITAVDVLPLPPDPVTVEAQFAYIINQANGRLTLVPAGTVPAGVPCDASQAIRDSNGITAFLVPESAVVWSGTVQRSVVFSPCGN